MVFVKKAILHILDNNIDLPVLSDRCITLDEDTKGYIETHIEKLIGDSEIKNCAFQDENSLIKEQMMNIGEENFIETTKAIASQLFTLMYENVDILAADVIFCIFEYENDLHIGIIKLNYKNAYIHNFTMFENERENTIIKQQTAIASEKQKIDECIFMNLMDETLLVKDKKCEINGVKAFYLAEYFLGATSELSIKQNYNAIEKTSQKIVKEYYNNDIAQYAKIKEVMSESLNESELDVENVVKKAFGDNANVQAAYKESLAENGVSDSKIAINEEIGKKITKRQRIITDNGIELKIPTEFINDQRHIEFLMNADGSISILIKSLNNIVGR